jgi:hypothetical protein
MKNSFRIEIFHFSYGLRINQGAGGNHRGKADSCREKGLLGISKKNSRKE